MKHIFQKSMGYIVAGMCVLMYFVFSYLIVSDWSINSAKTIMEGLLIFASSVMVYSSLTKQGILNGRSEPKYIETQETHLKAKQKILPKIKYLQSWLDKDYRTLMKVGRTVFTDSAGYDYSEVFTEDGKFVDGFKVEKPKFEPFPSKTKFKLLRRMWRFIFSEEWKLYREKKRYIQKVRHYKITRLTVSKVVNIDADEDPNNFGISEKVYLKKQMGSNIVSRLIFSFMIPSVSFAFNGFNIETFLVQLLSVMLIVISSLVSMFSAYFFIVRTHRGSIIKMINKIEEFDNADLTEFKNDKEKEDERIHSEKSVCTESPMVEEIRTEPQSGEDGDVCSNT